MKNFKVSALFAFALFACMFIFAACQKDEPAATAAADSKVADLFALSKKSNPSAADSKSYTDGLKGLSFDEYEQFNALKFQAEWAQAGNDAAIQAQLKQNKALRTEVNTLSMSRFGAPASRFVDDAKLGELIDEVYRKAGSADAASGRTAATCVIRSFPLGFPYGGNNAVRATGTVFNVSNSTSTECDYQFTFATTTCPYIGALTTNAYRLLTNSFPTGFGGYVAGRKPGDGATYILLGKSRVDYWYGSPYFCRDEIALGR
ncbi:MAG: hypothetical protein AVDCRST_MAG56-3466 [uncultured Cytophagales bacterium]|uniref:Lipoprotein n=1 Tax=uncultured Cytophagales bacterium TaxID=158755 RepID=A0A6J4JF64_9SPHI|nr:MAG: hypothetical protein AVDCRST_MAG56-3466 [uncultured Cytophagales bacterium]